MVNWTKPATQQLKRIYDYISLDSVIYAKKIVFKIHSKSKEIQHFPFKNRVVPELNDYNIREIFVYSYRVIYEVRDDQIYVISVLHFRQNFENN